ncbi:MAG: DF family (seleno)protein [Solirubrobacterales bacterium]
MSRDPEIELLWWQGCPSWERATQILREEMEAVGLDPASARVTEIETADDAERTDFPGSPTIRIDGSDFQPPGPDEPRGLTCRVYRRRDGRASPLPDREDLRQALEKARDR